MCQYAGAAGAMGVLKAVPQTYGNFTSPVESFEYAARIGKLKINNNPINFYCFGNAVLDTDRNENKKPIKRSQSRKIDGVITMLMTFGYLTIISNSQVRPIYQEISVSKKLDMKFLIYFDLKV